MARKYALINNNVVTEVVTLEDSDIALYSKTNNLVIDIEDISPQPAINWVLNGNKLEFPQSNSDREKLEECLAQKKMDTGFELSNLAIVKIGARNKILNKSGAQVSALLTQLLSIKLLLETGALSTARDACNQLKVVYTEYTDIFDLVINRINDFERDNGL